MIRLVLAAWLTGLTVSLPVVGWLQYGPAATDQSLQTDHQTVSLGQAINVFGTTYSEVVISKDGLLSFGGVVEYEEFNFTSGSRDPRNDPPFVAPFYYNGQSVAADNVGKIFYRVLSGAALSGLQDDTGLANGTVGVSSFLPVLALVVTWENVTDSMQIQSGACTGKSSSPCQSSTFQLVLMASREETFFSVTYRKMDVPTQPFYQAGINSGQGYGWTGMCPWCGPGDLPSTDGFIFRMTNGIPQRSGCNNDIEKLEIQPKVAMMFGGKLLDISGPCPQPTDEIYCRFRGGDTEVKTLGFSVNGLTIRCPVPRLTRRGFVTVSVSIDGDRTYIGQGQIYVVMPGPLPRSIDLGSEWYEVTPASLTLTWDAAALSDQGDAKVDIKLLGYRETETEIIWKDLAVLALDSNNTGTFSFSPSEYRCTQTDCEVFEVGLVEVELQRTSYKKANSRVAMNAGVVPLGWYVHEAMTNKYGGQWTNKRCEEWYHVDKQGMAWMEKLLYCPCNVDQAMADFGRWQPDVGCNMFSASSGNCYYHKGANHCVRSFQPSSTGAGNQCCYKADGLLSYAADTYQGSTPDKGHDWGAYPYDKPGYVPSFSHWIDDVVTFYYCCLWNNYSHCDYYMEQRATRDCTGYRPSKAASAFGDPHIMTFDGKIYNFGGKGEFTLVNAKDFTIQGKFRVGKQTHDDGRMYNATTLTSIALRSSTSSKVEARLAPEGMTSGRRLDVFVDGELHVFDSLATAKKDFTGVSVINFGITVNSSNNRHENFTILLQSGVGVQVADSHGLLHVVVNIPPDFKNMTYGLMGTWNDDADDDFITPHGDVVDAGAAPAAVYNDFCLSWKVTESESLFAYYNPADENFTPIFEEPSLHPGDLEEDCKGDNQCRFDYIVTGNRDIGIASRQAHDWFAEMQSFQRLAETCGLLDVPYSLKDNYNYTLANTVTVTGCRNGGTVTGDTTYTCKDDSGKLKWTPGVTAKCEVSKGTKGDTSEAPRALISTSIFVSIILSIYSLMCA